MIPRPLLLGAAIGALAVAPPAFGRDDEASRLGEAMRDPAAQQATAAAAQAMTEALLDLRLAPLAEAIEAAHGAPQGTVDPNLSLRDYAGPEAAQMPEEMGRRLPAMMGAMGNMAGAFEIMMPQLRATARIMREQMDEALAR